MLYFSGNEKEEWSDSDADSTADQSEFPNEPHLPVTQLRSCDGYESGDLGDISSAYVTEAPGREGESSDDSLSGDTKKGLICLQKTLFINGNKSVKIGIKCSLVLIAHHLGNFLTGLFRKDRS